MHSHVKRIYWNARERWHTWYRYDLSKVESVIGGAFKMQRKGVVCGALIIQRVVVISGACTGSEKFPHPMWL